MDLIKKAIFLKLLRSRLIAYGVKSEQLLMSLVLRAYRRWLLRTFEINEARELLEGHLMNASVASDSSYRGRWPVGGEEIDSTVTLDRRSRVRFLS